MKNQLLTVKNIKSFIIFLTLTIFFVFSLISKAQAQNACSGDMTGGLQAMGCQKIKACEGCSVYCGWANPTEIRCQCPGAGTPLSSCYCTTKEVVTACTKDGQESYVCKCTTGGTCTNPGGVCGTVRPYTGYCNPDDCEDIGDAECLETWEPKTHWCTYTASPTATPAPGAPTNTPGPSGPTNTPKPTNTPTPTNTPGGPTNTPSPDARDLIVTLNFYRSANSTYNDSAKICSALSSNELTNNYLVSWTYKGVTQSLSVFSQNQYQFLLNNVQTNDLFSVTVKIIGDSNYSCTCPQGCSYIDLSVPAGDEVTRNIYFYDYADAWFQVFGANAFAGNALKSIVPDLLCSLPICQAGVFVPQPNSSNYLTSGFPFLRVNTLGIDVIDTHLTEPLKNIHLTGQRTSVQSADAFALAFNPQAFTYSHFKQLAEDAVGTLPSEHLSGYSDWTIAEDKTNFFFVDGDQTIDQNTGIHVPDKQKVVIFVNGNLTIRDTSASGGSKVTSVARKTSPNSASGGFLAFFVSGDIIIDPSVGSTLDLDDHENITAVTHNKAHIEGVFFSDQSLRITGGNSYPNRKFIGAGTFIGSNNISLGRRADDGSETTEAYKIHNTVQALENFLYRPDLLINWPKELKTSVMNWQEIAPKTFNF